MKKVIAMYFLFTIVTLLVACSTQTNKTQLTTEEKALLEKSRQDSINQLSASDWQYNYFVDDFGDKTNKGYILFEDNNGSFSNSATANSDLTVHVIINKETSDSSNIDCRFDLYEYQRGPSVGKQIGGAIYHLNIKNLNGEVDNYSLWASEKSLYLEDKDEKRFLQNLLSNYTNVKAKIDIRGEYSNNMSYNFTIKNGGLNNIVKEQFQNQFAIK